MQANQIYIHRCYENELGYRLGVAKKAGGFLFINKKQHHFSPI
ncbi:hypothetical protein [Sulfurimonas sp.]|nr:hypothetical protein [Sulfurimonas sp.]